MTSRAMYFGKTLATSAAFRVRTWRIDLVESRLLRRPTEITGSTFCYRVLEHAVPLYFVNEELRRVMVALATAPAR
jgi:hypothetical protein